ncbi:MAG: rane protein [Sphingomonas bacterium]|nr:lipopolysaccharide biosynthesis protein [Sphingomonas bacterium]MDB5689788.1 rane protein [Sphingomonas bacterium]
MDPTAGRSPPSKGADTGGSRPSGGTARRIYFNFGKLIGGKAGAGLVSLLYLVVAVRVLGPHDYGVLILVHTFAMTVGGIVEFPGWHAVVRYGAQAIESADEHRLARLLRFAALVEGAGGLCAIVTAMVLGPLIGDRLGWSPTALAFALPYSFAVLASIRATPAGYLQLCGRFDLLSAHVLISPLVRLFGAGGIALFGGGLHAFLVVWLAAALIEWASMWLIGILELRRQHPQARMIGSTRGVRSENDGIWRFMIGANTDATFGDLAPRIAPLAVGWVMGPTAAALYAVAQRATVVISQPAQLLGQAAYAELAHLAAGGGGASAIRRALFQSIAVAVAISIPVLVIIGVAAHPLARLIGGAAFEQAGNVMLLLAVARAILLVGPPASAALIALGRPGLSASVNLGTSLGLLPLLPPMMLLWGLNGAGGHALLQAAVAAALLAWYASRDK